MGNVKVAYCRNPFLHRNLSCRASLNVFVVLLIPSFSILGGYCYLLLNLSFDTFHDIPHAILYTLMTERL